MSSCCGNQVLPTTSSANDDEDSRSVSSLGDNEIVITGDQFEKMTDSKLKLGVFELWALGISTALGGHYFLWNFGLVIGFGSFMIAVVIIASAYACLILCISELSGALPFAGGAYGITRVTMGSFFGYLVAFFDSYRSMFFAMLCVFILGYLITIVSEKPEQVELQPIWWFLIYGSYLVIHSIGGRVFWYSMKILSIGSLLLLVIYVLGSAKFADFDENAPLYVFPVEPENNRWMSGNEISFFRILPICCWFFVGVESLNLASHDAVNPKTDVPRAYVLSYITIVIMLISTVFICCSVYPGTQFMTQIVSPTAPGYMLMFDIDYFKASIFSIPPIYTAGFGFTYHYSSQVRAMGKSGLVNFWLGYDIPFFNTPVPALLLGAIIGYGVGLRYHFYKALKQESLFSVALIGAMLAYISQFVSFIMLRWYYPTIKREFVSPLGVYGAIYGIVVFSLVLAVLLGLQASLSWIAFIVFIVLLVVYYFTVVIHRQVFSEDEKTVLFKAYLMKTNRQRAGRLRVGHQTRTRASMSSSSPAHSRQDTDSNQGTFRLHGGASHQPHRAGAAGGGNRSVDFSTVRSADSDKTGILLLQLPSGGGRAYELLTSTDTNTGTGTTADGGTALFHQQQEAHNDGESVNTHQDGVNADEAGSNARFSARVSGAGTIAGIEMV
mmetsp:Transcript_37549/g.74763  ORF Transcript_37549/g.74763 Transcript_37549/m.74763 type:complete len:667 (+) Transcript_37549:121-2121(+)